MAASAVPGYGKMPTLPAPADNVAGKDTMLANVQAEIAVANRSSSFADHAKKVLQQVADWVATIP